MRHFRVLTIKAPADHVWYDGPFDSLKYVLNPQPETFRNSYSVTVGDSDAELAFYVNSLILSEMFLFSAETAPICAIVTEAGTARHRLYSMMVDEFGHFRGPFANARPIAQKTLGRYGGAEAVCNRVTGRASRHFYAYSVAACDLSPAAFRPPRGKHEPLLLNADGPLASFWMQWHKWVWDALPGVDATVLVNADGATKSAPARLSSPILACGSYQAAQQSRAGSLTQCERGVVMLVDHALYEICNVMAFYDLQMRTFSHLWGDGHFPGFEMNWWDVERFDKGVSVVDFENIGGIVGPLAWLYEGAASVASIWEPVARAFDFTIPEFFRPAGFDTIAYSGMHYLHGLKFPAGGAMIEAAVKNLFRLEQWLYNVALPVFYGLTVGAEFNPIVNYANGGFGFLGVDLRGFANSIYDLYAELLKFLFAVKDNVLQLYLSLHFGPNPDRTPHLRSSVPQLTATAPTEADYRFDIQLPSFIEVLPYDRDPNLYTWPQPGNMAGFSVPCKAPDAAVSAASKHNSPYKTFPQQIGKIFDDWLAGWHAFQDPYANGKKLYWENPQMPGNMGDVSPAPQLGS